MTKKRARGKKLPETAVPELVLRVLRQFPGLPTLTPAQFGALIHDEHALLHGEVKRWRLLCQLIDQKRREFAKSGDGPDTVHASLLRVIHRFFVGQLTDRYRTTVPMYAGTSADFEEDGRRWVAACSDVEAAYSYLMTYLPATARVGRKTISLKERLARPPIVTATHDLLTLIELVRFHDDPLVRHYARGKLVLAQFCFEARKEGYEPDRLRREATELATFIGGAVFGGEPGEAVEIAADLDPARHHACRVWQSVKPGMSSSLGYAHPFVIPTREQHISLPSGRRISCYFSIRSKQNVVLKALVKDIRFLDLMGIGDAVAMRFMVQGEDLDEFVRFIRGILVPCPGQVCDQGSSIGFRAGQGPLDAKNRQSSRSYEAMKYVARICGRAVEVQIVPMHAWINAQCMHDRVNHSWYKLSKYFEEVLPILYPKHLLCVPWESRALRRQAVAHILANRTNGS